MSQSAVADRERVLPELGEHRADDAGAREDDVGSRRLEADDRPSFVGAARAVELDLPVDSVRSSTVPCTTSGSYAARACRTAARFVAAPP